MIGSRSTSPVAGDGGDANLKASLKRKADELPGTPILPSANGQVPKQKKRKAPVPGGAPVPSAELESMLLEWLKNTPNASTRDCIQHFTPFLVDAEKKAEFSAMVRKHATLKNGVLVTRTRGASSAPSPPPA